MIAQHVSHTTTHFQHEQSPEQSPERRMIHQRPADTTLKPPAFGKNDLPILLHRLLSTHCLNFELGKHGHYRKGLGQILSTIEFVGTPAFHGHAVFRQDGFEGGHRE